MTGTKRINCTLKRGYSALSCGLRDFVRRVPPLRVARILSLVCLDMELVPAIAASQHPDGGWSDVEETVWCTRALLAAGGFDILAERAISWLRKKRQTGGGWGLSDRDAPRIITTSLTVTMLPELGDHKAIEWLSRAWTKDLNEAVRLTYKGGIVLAALSTCRSEGSENNLVANTLHYLNGQQNDDGGFGPWKGHPIGSDPWSTGIVLVGLTSWPDKADPRVIERAADWLCRTQLESGLWPYHFIDEGSAYAYWGLSKALDYFQRRAR